MFEQFFNFYNEDFSMLTIKLFPSSQNTSTEEEVVEVYEEFPFTCEQVEPFVVELCGT